MNPDDLESQIRALPERPLPESWRAEILRHARTEASELAGDSRDGGWWPQWLTFGRASAGALVATWMLILVLNAGTSDAPSGTRLNFQADADAVRHYLEQQRRMLADVPPAAAPKPEPLGPPLGDRRRFRAHTAQFS